MKATLPPRAVLLFVSTHILNFLFLFPTTVNPSASQLALPSFLLSSRTTSHTPSLYPTIETDRRWLAFCSLHNQPSFDTNPGIYKTNPIGKGSRLACLLSSLSSNLLTHSTNNSTPTSLTIHSQTINNAAHQAHLSPGRCRRCHR